MEYKQHIYCLLEKLHRFLSPFFERIAPGWGLRRRFSWLNSLAIWLESQEPGKLFTSLFTDKEIKCVLSNDISLYVFPNDKYVANYLLMNHVWEPVETMIFKSEIKPGAVIIDIGANIGYFSILAGKLLQGDGKVIAFEPEPNNFRLLKRNIKLNKMEANVIPLQLAASDTARKSQLHLSDSNRGDNRLAPSATEIFSKTTSVDCQPLDSYLNEKYSALIPSISFIKMDVQGHETFALKGMKNILRSNDLRLLIEFSPHMLRNAGSSAQELLNFMASHDYQPVLVRSTVDDSGFFSPLTRGIIESLELSTNEHANVNLYFTKRMIIKTPSLTNMARFEQGNTQC